MVIRETNKQQNTKAKAILIFQIQIVFTTMFTNYTANGIMWQGQHCLEYYNIRKNMKENRFSIFPIS